MTKKFMKKAIVPMLSIVMLLSQISSAVAMSPDRVSGNSKENAVVVLEIGDSLAAAQAATAAPTTTAALYATVTSVASANDAGFNDLKGYEWAASAINAMASKGIVVGTGNNRYSPAAQVTREQFASMILRYYGEDVINKLVQQATDKAATSENYTSLAKLNEAYKGNWSNSIICAIQMFPKLDSKWGCSKVYWGGEATRSDMALIIMTIAEQLGSEKFEIKDNIQNNIGDIAYISNDPSKDEILKAYSAGILVGTNSAGDYNPSGNATRAEAAIIMERVTNPSKRSEVLVKVPEVPTVQAGDNVIDGTVYPKEGDVINGVKVTRDKDTGILGLGNGQKGGIYLGVKEIYVGGSIHPIEVGTEASETYDNMTLGATYLSKGGYVFWGKEFTILDNYARARLPVADKSNEGKMADIKGNITTNSSEAFYKCVKTFLGDYHWDYQF